MEELTLSSLQQCLISQLPIQHVQLSRFFRSKGFDQSVTESDDLVNSFVTCILQAATGRYYLDSLDYLHLLTETNEQLRLKVTDFKSTLLSDERQ